MTDATKRQKKTTSVSLKMQESSVSLEKAVVEILMPPADS
jgi:topoisomerase IA-like protein